MEQQEPTTAGCIITLMILLFTIGLAATLLAHPQRVVSSPSDWEEDSGER